MQTSQWKWISMGVLLMGGLVYSYRQQSRCKQQYQANLNQYYQTHIYSTKNQHKTIQQIMRDKQYGTIIPQKKFQFIRVMPKYNSETFKLYQRERSLFIDGAKYSPDYIMEHQMGGQFVFDHQIKNMFKQNKQNVKCKLNDFNLSTRLLKQQKQKVHLFKGINNIQPLVCSVISTLIPNTPISIYGNLYYDNDKLTWIIQPFFLAEANNMKQVVQRYYNRLIGDSTLTQIAIVVCGLVLGYFTIINPFSRWFRRKRQEWSDHRDHKQKQYANDYILVRGESLLNCQRCKLKNVQIVYQCGHLAMCADCHQQNELKLCPLCNKQSNKFMKIYMA